VTQITHRSGSDHCQKQNKLICVISVSGAFFKGSKGILLKELKTNSKSHSGTNWGFELKTPINYFTTQGCSPILFPSTGDKIFDNIDR
jgi:hypothetical protein